MASLMYTTDPQPQHPDSDWSKAIALLVLPPSAPQRRFTAPVYSHLPIPRFSPCQGPPCLKDLGGSGRVNVVASVIGGLSLLPPKKDYHVRILAEFTFVNHHNQPLLVGGFNHFLVTLRACGVCVLYAMQQLNSGNKRC